MGSPIHDNDYAKICSSCNRYKRTTVLRSSSTHMFSVCGFSRTALHCGSWAKALYRKCSYYNIQHSHPKIYVYRRMYTQHNTAALKRITFRWRFIIRPAFSTTSSLYKQKPSRKHARHTHKHNIKGKPLALFSLCWR